MYKISVVIPTVGENTLSNVLEALNNSTIKPFEVILSIHEDNFDSVKDYYLYQESITVQIDHKKISPVEVAKPHEKFDDNFNKIVKTYTGKVFTSFI